MHEATDFSAHVVVVKTLFLSEIYKLEREINKQVERKYQYKGSKYKIQSFVSKIQDTIICIKNTRYNHLYQKYKTKYYNSEQ